MSFRQTDPPGLVLDLASFRLIRDGQHLKLQRAPMELLTLLVRRHGALVTREEIVNVIWGDGVHVEVDAGINSAILKIRRALDDDSSCPRYLETVVGKGYRFVGPITITEPTSEAHAAPAGSIVGRRRGHFVHAAGIGAGLIAFMFLAAAATHRGSRAKLANPQVVEAYLRGRFEMSRNNLSEATHAYFERAAMLDPSYAPAQAGLADFYRSRAISDDEGAERAWPRAERYASEALSLDADNADAHVAAAQITLMHDWDWHGAREHALRALQLNPSSPEAHAVYARYLRIAGNLDEAVNHRKQAAALDPFRTDLQLQLALEYFFARDYQDAVVLARQALAVDANNQVARGILCVNLGRIGQFDESVAECSKDLAADGHADWIPGYVQEYRKRGYDAATVFLAKKDLDDILMRRQPDLWKLANAYVAAGMQDEALPVLFEGLKTHEPGLLQIRVDPDFDSIRSDPRYAELVRQIGFPSE